MPKRAEGTRELAIEWLQHRAESGVQLGHCDRWVTNVALQHADEDTCLDVGDWTKDLVAQLPRYVEIVKLLKANNQEALSRAVEIAEELK